MATRFETSPRQRRGSWLARFGGGPTLTREEIERDAAAQLGVPVGDQPEPENHEHEEHQAEAPARPAERRPGRIGSWLRGLVSPEPADVRRQRIEAEAAAELGLSGQPEHPTA